MLYLIGAVFGGLLGYLRGVDLQQKKPQTNPTEWAIGGAILGALLLPAVESLYL